MLRSRVLWVLLYKRGGREGAGVARGGDFEGGKYISVSVSIAYSSTGSKKKNAAFRL